jgi:hypothetical protein
VIARCGRVGLFQFREPEVEHFHPAVGADEDVARLQIAVHDAPLMCRSQTVRERHGQFQDSLERKSAGPEELCQRLPLDVLHRQQEHTVDLLNRVQRD